MLTAVSFAASQGNFELNVFMPVIIYNFLQSARLLADGITSFNDNCAFGIKANKEKIGTEEAGRKARYDFFEEVYENYDADAVLTAHNKDDNAETILYRAIKGTGLVGLKGISQKRDKFYRPLLNTTRAEIMDYCDINNLSPNNDSSNSDITFRLNINKP